MQRRKLLFFAPLAPLGFFLSRRLNAFAAQSQKKTDFRQQAFELNQLATSIRTPLDARLLVDFVADIFSKELLPAWNTGKLRERIAATEFGAVSDPDKLVSEGRIAYAWNGFVRTIGVPQQFQVSEVEIHNLRDAFLSTASYSWQRGDRTIWTAPGIYAVDDQGTIAVGCRAIESLRVLWDLANMPANTQAARDRVKQGLLASDQLRESEHQPPAQRKGFVSVTFAEPNPIEVATRKFIHESGGIGAFGRAVSTMLDETLV